MRFAAAVDCALTAQMSADVNSGLIAKNPVHEHWRTYTVNSEPYELGEIADYLDLDQYADKRRALPECGLGWVGTSICSTGCVSVFLITEVFGHLTTESRLNDGLSALRLVFNLPTIGTN